MFHELASPLGLLPATVSLVDDVLQELTLVGHNRVQAFHVDFSDIVQVISSVRRVSVRPSETPELSKKATLVLLLHPELIQDLRLGRKKNQTILVLRTVLRCVSGDVNDGVVADVIGTAHAILGAARTVVLDLCKACSMVPLLVAIAPLVLFDAERVVSYKN